DLPEPMRGMAPAERHRYVQEQLSRRNEIAQRIQALSEERARFLAEAQKQSPPEENTETLDSAAVRTVRQQLQARGFQME
ncbi:MAG: hypothetical protein RMJ35_05390, partial [Phycisphaerales bacterium]|nr:hypothetical protein [Phycisphaerales bacterium]